MEKVQEVTDTRTGLPHILSNIHVLENIFNILSTTLGPYGRDKLFLTSTNDYLITNDGITILRKLNLEHPIERLLKQISESQERVIGDGTTSVVLMAIEMLYKVKILLEDGMESETIVQAIDYIQFEILKFLSDNNGNSDDSNNNMVKIIDDSNKISMIEKVIETTLSSKILYDEKQVFSKKIAQSIENNVRYSIKKCRGSVKDTEIFEGIVLGKTFSYAGHEQLPKKIEDAKILVIEDELELKALRENAELKIEKTENYQNFVDAEYKNFYCILERIVESGANIIISTKAIGDYATQYFAKKGIFCMGRVPASEVKNICVCFNAEPIISMTKIDKNSLGTVKIFEEKNISNQVFYFFYVNNNKTDGIKNEDVKKEKVYTIFLKGAGDEIIEELGRSLDDAIKSSYSALRCNKLVRGGGSFELSMAIYIKNLLKKAPTEYQMVLKYIAQSFEIIPFCLSANFGHNPQETMKKMRASHIRGEMVSVSEKMDGISVDEMILEPLNLKEYIIKAAFGFVKAVLKIDSSYVIKE